MVGTIPIVPTVGVVKVAAKIVTELELRDQLLKPVALCARTSKVTLEVAVKPATVQERVGATMLTHVPEVGVTLLAPRDTEYLT